jgi:hypothetical protein
MDTGWKIDENGIGCTRHDALSKGEQGLMA